MSIRSSNSWPTGKIARLPVKAKVTRSEKRYQERVAESRRIIEQARVACGAPARSR
jgi:hypothetical protein